MHRKKFDAVLKSVAGLFKILSHPDRIRLVGLLQSREMDVTQLSQAVGLSQSAASQHLKLLKFYNILSERREGRHVYYSLHSPLVSQVVCSAIELQTTDLNQESDYSALLSEMKSLWHVEP